MPSSWLKRRFNYIKRLSGFVSGSAKSVDESGASLGKNIRNDLNSGNRWAKEEKNAYRDYTKNRDQSLVERNILDSKKFIDEEKKCNVNALHVTPSDNRGSEEYTGHDGIDGRRIHGAMVSKVNAETRSVTVEWYENGETKGKEVELDAILELNNEVEAAASSPKIVRQISGNPLSREASHSSLEDDSYYDEDDDDGIEHTSSGSVGQTSGGTLPIRQTTTTRSNPTQGLIRVNLLNNNVATNGHRTTRAATYAGQNNQDTTENIPPAAPIARSRLVQPNRMSSSNIPQMHAQQTSQQTSQQQQQQQTSQQKNEPRRSYAVKEVEKLKENREKRRARQAEMKEEKNALMNLDPGNPNWELAKMIRDYTCQIDFRPLTDGQPIDDHQITVCVRKRPVSRKEMMKKELDVISVPTKDQLLVHEPKSKVDLTKYLENHKFRFDYAFSEAHDNEMVYKYTAKPLVKTIFEGGMATCFAYGQTGSGKTHTMGGQFNGKVQDSKNGIYAMAAKDVFAQLRGAKYRHLNLVISCSFFEIYSGKVFDLLADKQKLRVMEDGKQQVQVVGLTEKVVDNVDDVLKIINHGNSTRTSGQTSANTNSSRSHAIFQIVLRPPGSSRIHGKFSFIDLAGNERGADTQSANRQVRMEGAEINKSLLALKECIRALGKQSVHLPFRVSKLTQVLRDSFIGEKSKTCMIAMISPGLSSCEHTLNTLRYANRVKELDPEKRQHDDVEQMESDDKNGDNENDLVHLRSLNENDMSDEMFNQHAAISDLQQAEELAVDQHKLVIEFLTGFLPETRKLYAMTNYVEYDQDAYCKNGIMLFNQLISTAEACRDLLGDFQTKLANEEMLSHKVKTNPDKR